MISDSGRVDHYGGNAGSIQLYGFWSFYIQLVLYLNDQRKKQGQGFVIEDLDDTTLLIQPGNEKFLEDKLEEFYEENYFQRPLREGEVAVGAAAKRRKR